MFDFESCGLVCDLVLRENKNKKTSKHARLYGFTKPLALGDKDTQQLSRRKGTEVFSEVVGESEIMLECSRRGPFERAC